MHIDAGSVVATVVTAAIVGIVYISAVLTPASHEQRATLIRLAAGCPEAEQEVRSALAAKFLSLHKYNRVLERVKALVSRELEARFISGTAAD